MARPAYLSVKNYEHYQHYKDRSPPWIKLYRSILHDYSFRQLSEQDRYRYIGCLILACETENKIPLSDEYLVGILGLTTAQVDLRALIKSGLLIAHGAIARRGEKRQRREETEKSRACVLAREGDSSSDFEAWWAAYPSRNGKKIGKKKTKPLFEALSVEDQAACIVAAKHYATSEMVGRGFAKDPERFLKDDYWREWLEPEVRTNGNGKPLTGFGRTMEKIKALEAEKKAQEEGRSHG